jgi:hypothetical protein
VLCAGAGSRYLIEQLSKVLALALLVLDFCRERWDEMKCTLPEATPAVEVRTIGHGDEELDHRLLLIVVPQRCDDNK